MAILKLISIDFTDTTHSAQVPLDVDIFFLDAKMQHGSQNITNNGKTTFENPPTVTFPNSIVDRLTLKNSQTSEVIFESVGMINSISTNGSEEIKLKGRNNISGQCRPKVLFQVNSK